MAYQNNNYQQGNQNNYQQGNQNNYELTDVSVSHVMKWQDGSITFSMTIHGVTIYGMRVVGFTDKQDGKHKRFVAFPKRKSNDGNYYHIAYYKLSNAEEIEVLRLVDNAVR